MPDVLSYNGTYWYSLKGPKGDIGAPGTPGATGPAGNTGPAGAPGQVIIPGLLIDLDNENQPVGTDHNGQNGNYEYAKTNAKVYDNGVDVTADWTFQFPIVSDPGVHGGPINGDSKTFHVTDLVNIDTGAVKFTATKTGSPLLSADFVVYKVKGGADGTPALVAMLESSAAAVNQNNTGTYTPPILLFSAFSVTGQSPRVPYLGRFKIETQSSINSQWSTSYTSAVDEITTNFAVLPNTKMIRVTLYKSGSTTDVWDSEGIPVVKDGRPGTDGAPGSSGIIIDLDNQAHTVPATVHGIVTDWTGCATTAYIYEGANDVSAQWTFDTPVYTGGLTGTLSNSNRTFTATGLQFDVGTATFRATKAGSSPITAVFTVTKVKDGEDGTPATVYRLNTQGVAVIRRDKHGDLIPNLLHIDVDAITSGVSKKEPFSIIGWVKKSPTSAWEEQYRVISAPEMNWDLNHLNMGIGTIQYRFAVAKAGAYGPPWIDEEVLPVVSDGQDGPAGPPGAGLALNLDNDNHGVPTDKDGNNGNFAGCISTATLYSSGNDISGSATWSAPTVVTGTANIVASNGNRTAQVTSMGTDVVSIRFRATFLGSVYDAIFTVQKVRAGADGATPIVYRLDADGVLAIKKSKYNNVVTLDPNYLVLRLKQTIGATTSDLGFFISFYKRTTTGGAWLLILQTGSDLQNTVSFSITGHTDAVQFKAVATHHGSWSTTPLDTEIFPIVVDGNDGPPGSVGPAGPLGNRGPGTFSKKMSQPADVQAAATQAIQELTGGPPFIRDIMTLYNGVDWSQTGVWTGIQWEPITQYMSGNVVLDGTLSANALAADTAIARRILVGSFLGDAAGSIQSNGFVANQYGFRLDGTGNAEFNNVKVRGDIITGTGNLIQNSAAEQLWANVETAGNAANSFGIVTDIYGNVPWFKKVFQIQTNNDNNASYLKFFKEFQMNNTGMRFPVAPGEKYQVSASVFSIGCDCGITVDFFDTNGTQFSNSGVLWNSAFGSKQGGRSIYTDYALLFGNLVVPTGAVSATVVFIKNGGGGNTLAGCTNVQLMPIPDIRVTSPIPWSPGGVTLVNTQSVAVQAITQLFSATYSTRVLPTNSSVEFDPIVVPKTTVKERQPWAVINFYGEVQVQPNDAFLYYASLHEYSDHFGMWRQLGDYASQKVVPSTGTELWMPCWISRIVNMGEYGDQFGQNTIQYKVRVSGQGMSSSKQVRNAYLSIHAFKR